MKKSLAIFCVCAAISGCATVQYNGGDVQRSVIDQPEVGTVATAFIGDKLLQKGELVRETVLKVDGFIDGTAYDIPPGTYKAVGRDQGNDFYSADGVIKGALADPPQALMVPTSPGSKVCVITVFNAKACYSGSFRKASEVSERAASFQQTLLYSGRVGDKIRISYREFSNSVARPAFNNEVEYDLSTSSVIGYKGARIEVIRADNTSITYKVLKSFE